MHRARASQGADGRDADGRDTKNGAAGAHETRG
jgi:hypothetical protein